MPIILLGVGKTTMMCGLIQNQNKIFTETFESIILCVPSSSHSLTFDTISKFKEVFKKGVRNHGWTKRK